MNKKTGTLGLFSLTAIGIGTAIGSGIVSVVGQAVAVTGTSAWVAIMITALLGIVMCAAPAFMCSMMRVSGGNYGFAALALNDYWAGVVGLSQFSSIFSMAMFGTSFGMYIHALIPSVSIRAAAIVVMTVFFVLNLMNIDVMSKVQNVMTVMLIGGLVLFIAFGMFNLDVEGTGVFNITAPQFFAGGFNGVLSAIMMMIFATTGMRFLVNFSQDAVHPKKDIPVAMFLTGIVIVVLYTGIAIVECGVLPIDQVAGQTLSVISQKLMPAPLYVVFMIGGPIMALTTTINSSFRNTAAPIQRAAADGFLPRFLGKNNRFGSPWVLIAIAYVCSMAPIIFDVSFQALVSASMAGSSLMQVVVWYCYFRGPRKVPEAWEKRYYKISRPVYDFLCIVAMVAWFVLWAVAVVDTAPAMLIMAAVIYAIMFIVPAVAVKYGSAKAEGAYDITLDM